MRLRKYLLLALLLVAPNLHAQIGQIQNPVTGVLNVQDAGTCSTANSFVIQQLPTNASTTTVNLSGTFSATATVRESNNGGASWTTAGTVNAAGTTTYATNGFSHLCVDVTTFVSGNVLVSISTGVLQIQSIVPGPTSLAPVAPSLGEVYLSTSCSGQSNCFPIKMDGQFDVSATLSTSATACGIGTVAAGHCVTTSANAPPFCDAGIGLPCTAAQKAVGHTTDNGLIGYATYNCPGVNPGVCTYALTQGTITAVIDAHHANFSNPALFNSVGGTNTNFVWCNDETTAMKNAWNTMLTLNNASTKLHLPAGTTCFSGDLFIRLGSGKVNTLAIEGAGPGQTILVPLAVLASSNANGICIYDQNFGQNVVGQGGAVQDRFSGFVFWGLGLDSLDGRSAVSGNPACIKVTGWSDYFENVDVVGWLWNQAVATYPGWDCSGCTLVNSGAYGTKVGGIFRGLNGVPTTITGGFWGGGVGNGIQIATTPGAGPVVTNGIYALLASTGATAALSETGGPWIDNGSKIQTANLSGGNAVLNGTVLDQFGGGLSPLVVAGSNVQLIGATATTTSINWLNMSSGSVLDECTTYTSAVTITGGTAIAECPVGGDTQLAKAAAQTAKTLFTVGPNTTQFRVHLSVQCTTTSASATVTPAVLYTDTSGTVQTVTGSAATCTALGSSSVTSQDLTFRAKTATNIQYQTTIANTPTYDVSVQVERLGIN